jgi:hypothetical protein
MTELLEALCVLLAISIAVVVRGVFKLRCARKKLERQYQRHLAAVISLERARQGEVADYREAVHLLTRKLIELSEEKVFIDQVIGEFLSDYLFDVEE